MTTPHAQQTKNSSISDGIEFLSKHSDVAMADEWYALVSPDHFWLQWRFAALKKLLSKDFAWGKILDVGCGNGMLIQQIKKDFDLPVCACDLNLKALRMIPAQEAPIYYYNIHDRASQLKGQFTTILLMDVLEHIQDPVAFLLSIDFHLKAGGRVIINVPALQIFYSQYDAVAGHVKRYTANTIAKELKSAGFEIECRAYWGLSLVPLLLIRKFLLLFYRPQDSIKVGFQPQSALVDKILRFLGQFETSRLPGVPVGSSLLVVARRKSER